ncbi:alpha/beta fold hydrolase [Pollutimonas harenae]|uniref:Alpha/beta fold hydrolase n=1 Tax=Pollutimonas harenae TaxID=657015 RepID=A0A853H0H2_9BURK|nr:alpha/beta fold hydrolase [Pollutimonas harenae]NYT85209.1 alpha/beta fold hydrolase [Pollutimonas harenae]TEA72418.1 alpha/beta fold hydrolase [Pollutimonas harenae]
MNKPPACTVRFGSFYAGGRSLHITNEPIRSIAFTESASYQYDPNGLFHIEQAYVQFFIPAQQRHPLPLVLLHGGGMSGTMWEQTPDGRNGWAQTFVEQGHAVYIVDNIERGRAGWAPFPGVWPDTPIIRSAEEAWTLFRLGEAVGFAERIPFAGQRFPVQHMESFGAFSVPRWLSNNDTAVDTFCAALDRIGPCIVLAHSHGGEVAFRAAAQRPDIVRGMIAVEPSGFCHEKNVSELGLAACLFVYGDYLDQTPLWRDLTSQAAAFKNTLRNAGINTHWCELPEKGITGNSHMLMMDNNNDVIARDIARWIQDSI